MPLGNSRMTTMSDVAALMNPKLSMVSPLERIMRLITLVMMPVTIQCSNRFTKGMINANSFREAIERRKFYRNRGDKFHPWDGESRRLAAAAWER